MTIMFGSHLSIAGGLHNALIEAGRLEMDCVQVFTKNQRQWSSGPLSDEQLATWHEHRRRAKLRSIVSHDSYLINLAGPTGPTRRKSIALLRDELDRCEQLKIGQLVTHPGAHVNAGGERAGLKRVAAALDRVHRDLPGYRVITSLEVTAGQGTNLGYRLEHLKQIIDRVREPERLSVCLDTAHLLAAGYDLESAAGMRDVLDQVERILGLERVAVVHVNDSRTGRSSRVDRHEHIGKGHVCLEALAVLVNHARIRRLPKILETPKGTGPGGRDWDAVNLARLRRMVKVPRSPAVRSAARTPRRSA